MNGGGGCLGSKGGEEFVEPIAGIRRMEAEMRMLRILPVVVYMRVHREKIV